MEKTSKCSQQDHEEDINGHCSLLLFRITVEVSATIIAEKETKESNWGKEGTPFLSTGSTILYASDPNDTTRKLLQHINMLAGYKIIYKNQWNFYMPMTNSSQENNPIHYNHTLKMLKYLQINLVQAGKPWECDTDGVRSLMRLHPLESVAASGHWRRSHKLLIPQWIALHTCPH